MRTYEIPCDCGKLLRFSSAKAGSTFICDCGTKINVPSLGEFKEAVQQDTTAPSLTLRDLTAFSVAGIVLIFVFRSWYVEWIMDPRVDSLFLAIGMTLVIVGYFWLKTLVSSEMGAHPAIIIFVPFIEWAFAFKRLDISWKPLTLQIAGAIIAMAAFVHYVYNTVPFGQNGM